MCIHMKHHQCLLIYLFIYLFKDILVNVLIKKNASSLLESKTGVNKQLVMLKGLYWPEQCK